MAQRLALKNAIAQILSCALQPNSDIQRLTEERKKALEMTEEYPFLLLEIIECKEEASAEKLMAATFLKNYIVDINSPRGYVSLDAGLKQKLSLLLVEILPQENASIRKMISSSLQFLVIKDYPNLFNAINNKIMAYLLSENVLEVTGAVEFMKELGIHRPLCESKVFFSPEYIEPLLNILHSENNPLAVRLKTVECMIQILINSKRSPYFSAAKARLTEVFQKLLTESCGSISDLRVKSEVATQIAEAVVVLPDDLSDLVTSCLPVIGQIMFNCAQEYKQLLLGHKETPFNEQEDVFYKLMYSILTLINNIFVLPNYSSLLTDSLNDFMYLLLIFMCPYDSLENELFLEEELDRTPEFDYSLRGRCGHILMIFMDRCEFQKFSNAFQAVVEKHITEANVVKETCLIYCSRIMEGVMYAVGLMSFMFVELEQNFLCFVEHWSDQVLVQRLGPHWFVLGRLLWLGSKFSKLLAPHTLTNHVTNILANYNSSNHSLRIACIDAMRTHLLTIDKNSNRLLFSNFGVQIAEVFFSISLFNQHLCLVGLQAMGHLYGSEPATAANCGQRLIQRILDTVCMHIGNDRIQRQAKFLLCKVVGNPHCKIYVENLFIPFLVKLSHRSCPSLHPLRSDLPERAFDYFNTVIKFYPHNLDDEVVLRSFQAAYACIMEVHDDSDLLAIATVFMTNLLMKAGYQIKNLRDAKGKVLAQYVPDMLFMLLEPHPHEGRSTAVFGRLCVISIMSLPGQMVQPMIEPILKALLSALQRSPGQPSIQSYCFIFAYMFMWQTESILTFLSGIPGPDGRSALAYFLNKWNLDLENSEKFEKSVTTLAICKMIEHSLTKRDNRINDCRIILHSPHQGECSGLEKLYLGLIRIFLKELEGDNHTMREEVANQDVLIRSHPLCDLDLVEHIKSFIRSYNTHHYINVLKKYVTENEDTNELEKHGLKNNNM